MKTMFQQSPCSIEKKLGNFSKYVRRQTIARFLAQFEIFKRQIGIKGSVIECGVHHGGGLMTWAKLSATLEPYNYHRKIIGFDTFSGFPSISEEDGSSVEAKQGNFAEDYDVFDELNLCIKDFDDNRFIQHIPKIELCRGDASQTIPAYIQNNKHLIVSLLYLDFDLYEPTVLALKHFVPRMPKGSIIAFDELNNSVWPGETIAMLESLNIGQCRIQCFHFEPNISFVQI